MPVLRSSYENHLEKLMILLSNLTAETGATITIWCKDHVNEEERVVCHAPWTKWQERVFYGKTLMEALENASVAKALVGFRIKPLYRSPPPLIDHAQPNFD